jgi:hypothetical protein
MQEKYMFYVNLFAIRCEVIQNHNGLVGHYVKIEKHQKVHGKGQRCTLAKNSHF